MKTRRLGIEGLAHDPSVRRQPGARRCVLCDPQYRRERHLVAAEWPGPGPPFELHGWVRGRSIADRGSQQCSHSSRGFSQLRRPGRIVEHAGGPRQSIMLAQRRPGILSTERPAALQPRDDPTAECVELRRQQGRHDIEPVRCAGSEPVLNQIRNLLRCACGDVVSARAGQITKQLPQCRPVSPN
jgi:hypothetical protein